MRFLADSPDIPDTLLEARDRGDVVFFCGTGVSKPAGMPNFLELAKYVVDKLGAAEEPDLKDVLKALGNNKSEDHEKHLLLQMPIDQIFNLLQQEYGPEKVDNLISRRLKTKKDTRTNEHEIILRLSKNTGKNPQIVTTNYDLLFEYTAKKMNIKLTHFSPSSMPNLYNHDSWSGIVYLHGRLSTNMKPYNSKHEYIVSSSDFGLAYLADGWATRFIQELLNRCTVVFLGYSANDVPVKYLFHGLHSKGPAKHKMYAFVQGSDALDENKWRGMGVEPLSYPESADEPGYIALWETLSEWAERADNPYEWRKKVIALAKDGPSNLAPYERGQVVSLVKSAEGMKMFAEADPSPPSEWLCVFDESIRVKNGVANEKYRLDDDSLHFESSPYGTELFKNREPPRNDLFLIGHNEEHTDLRKRIISADFQPINKLSSRLGYLMKWIVKKSDEPIVVWWVVKNKYIHPKLLSDIELRISKLDNKDFSRVKSIWCLLIEIFRYSMSRDIIKDSFYRAANCDWTEDKIRLFERYSSPYIINKKTLRQEEPPENNWSNLDEAYFIDFCLKFPEFRDLGLNKVPDTVTITIYRILRMHLERVISLSSSISTGYTGLRISSLYPESVNQDEQYMDNANRYIRTFCTLFDKMATINPDILRKDINTWPQNEPFIFGRLYLYAWSYDCLFTGDQVADGLCSFSHELFQSSEHRRDLLHLLRNRWQGIPEERRKHIEQRFFDGTEDPDDVQNVIKSVKALKWLQKQGCLLSMETQDYLSRQLESISYWDPQCVDTADRDNSSKVRRVTTNYDPSLIIDQPIEKIPELVERHTGDTSLESVDNRPFDGLVVQKPRKALLVLLYCARRRIHDPDLWCSVLSNWPDNTSNRWNWVLGIKLSQLPAEIHARIDHAHAIPDWLEKNIFGLIRLHRENAIKIFDACMNNLCGTSLTPDDEIGPGYCPTVINRSVYRYIKIMLYIFKDNSVEHNTSVQEIRTRINKFLNACGEVRDHAIFSVARHLTIFYSRDPDFTINNIVPLFDPNKSSAKPAWHGYLQYHDLPEIRLFHKIKPYFIDVIVNSKRLNLGRDEMSWLHCSLVLGCFRKAGVSGKYISFSEARSILQRINDEGRVQCIRFLEIIIKETQNAEEFARVFIKDAWPGRIQYMTQKTSLAFFMLAAEARENFPDMVRIILPNLGTVSTNYLHFYRFCREKYKDPKTLINQHPEECLTLLDRIISDSPDEIPQDLHDAVEMIAKSESDLRQDSRWQRLMSLSRPMS